MAAATTRGKESARTGGGRPFIALERVTLRVGDRHLLAGTDWTIRTGEQWAVTGPNGAGKTTLVRALAGRAAVVAGRIVRHGPESTPESVAYVGFCVNRHVMDREERLAEAEAFAGGGVARTTVRRLLAGEGSAPAAGDLVERFALAPLLDRRIDVLSNGERQRVLLARAVSTSPGLLILDEPFEGMDSPMRHRMTSAIGDLMDRGMQVVVVSHREPDLPAGITHVLRLQDDRVVYAGPRKTPALLPADTQPAAVGPPPSGPAESGGTVLVRMEAVSVSYGDTPVLDRLDWTVRSGEHWAVTGPNGCGKSTLLGLITTENLQGYAHCIELFGRRRGTGESVWDIRRRIGRVSPEIQLRYPAGVGVMKVVLSGFFDSFGLYQRADDRQRETARQWLDRLDLARHAQSRFEQISQGEQRLALLARAMVRAPRLMILDEPCQGLDPDHRKRVLGQIDALAAEPATTLIYVTHDPVETPGCITDVLAFEKRADGRYRTARRKP